MSVGGAMWSSMLVDRKDKVQAFEVATDAIMAEVRK